MSKHASLVNGPGLSRLIAVASLSSSLGGLPLRADSLICNEPISAIPTDTGVCTATVSFTVSNDDCGDYSCGPGLTQNGDTWSQTVGPGSHSYSCTSEESADGNPACACEAQILVEDTERPKVGTPAALNACYLTTTAAVDAGKAAVMAVATDNCAVDHIQLKLSEIDLTCRFVFSLVAVDAAGNESTPPTTFQVTVAAADDGTITSHATQSSYLVDENCAATVVFISDITDPCCVDIDSITASVELALPIATLEFDPSLDCVAEYARSGIGDDDADNDEPDGELDKTKVHVVCSARVSDLTTCFVKAILTIDAKDCCGNDIDPRPTGSNAFVSDKTAPEITCPPAITVERGDKICNEAVQNWLDSVKATDNCPFTKEYSASPDLPIPDGDPVTGFSNVIDVADSGGVLDVNLQTYIAHLRVGDLVVTLSHGGKTVTLIDRPGIPPAGLGCTQGPYLNVILDDEGTTPIEGACAANLTSPPNYRPNNPLSAFDGMDAKGEWTLNVRDFAAGGGTPTFLVNWHLTLELGPTITNDAPGCGFPPGSTTEVTFTAEDHCGNKKSCMSSITVDPLRRGAGDQKGSLLTFSKVEIKWDADGKLIQDTLLDVSNDADRDGVEVQAYFVNGDRQVEERHDMGGNVVQEFEPGWNTADCRFHLTKNQPHFWSAAKGSSKCQAFTVLDEDGPGRLDPEATDGTRLLRGFVVMWAVKFTEAQGAGTTVAGIPMTHPENGLWQEIRWNHLKGDALIVNYKLGSAWEYNAWAYQARCGETGEPTVDCVLRDQAGTCCAGEANPGRLNLDGLEYDINFDEVLLDFYSSGSVGLSSTGVGVMVDTDLTLHSMDIDVRQDGDGPVLTKAEFEIFNQNESKFSGTRRCICCWDQTLLSNYVRTVAIPNHFLRSKLGTDKGYARIDGVHSTECDYYDTCGLSPRMGPGMVVAGGYDFSRDTALSGVAFKILTFTGAKTNVEWAGGNLIGTGEQASTIIFDVEQGSGEAHGAAAKTDREGSVP